MSAVRTFFIVELVALVALLLVALGLAAAAAIESSLHDNALIGPAGSAWLLFGYTFLIGLAPVALIGAPGYFMLLRNRKADWLSTLTLAVTPGVILLFVVGDLGVWAIGCGLVVASITHLLCRRLAPNNSFKPNPLRGSA